MKKQFLVLGIFVMSAVMLMAQTANEDIRAAVNSLTARLTSPIEVSVGDFYLDGTQSVSGLSRYLCNRITAHAPDNDKLIVVPRTRGIDRVKTGGTGKGIIKGTFMQAGDVVYVTLQLVRDPGGEIIGTKEITISAAELKNLNVSLLPDNIVTPGGAVKLDDLIEPVPIPNVPVNPPVNTSALKIAAWPDSDSNTYFDGDLIKINLESNQNCYFKVYHIDKDGKMQLIYPHGRYTDNYLRANVKRTISEDPRNYLVTAPFGQDTVYVVASVQPLPLEANFEEVKISKNIIDKINRGLLIAGDNVQPVETVNAWFHYTSLAADYYDETYSYRKPANMTETIQNIRAEVVRHGGTFNGNEQGGAFYYTGVIGNYWVAGNMFTINMRRTGNQLTTQITRGSGTGYRFAIDMPKNMAQAVQAVRAGIEGKGGNFSGNEQQGNFRASGIAGQYNVADRVNITISDKPTLIPNSLIEKEVRSYFNGY